VLLCSVIDHVTLTLKLVGVVARGVGKLPINFGVSRTFCSQLIGQHLSDASRYLATFTFDLGGHSTCRWYGSSCSVCVPSLNFVGLPVRKILGIYCVSINPPGDLNLHLTSDIDTIVYPKVIPYTRFEHFGIIRFRVMLRTNRLTRKSYPRRPTESAWVVIANVSNLQLCTTPKTWNTVNDIY